MWHNKLTDMRIFFLIVVISFLTNCSQNKYDIKELRLLSYHYVQVKKLNGEDSMIIRPYLFATIDDLGKCIAMKNKYSDVYSVYYPFHTMILDSSMINQVLTSLKYIKSDSDVSVIDKGDIYDGPEISIFYKSKANSQKRIVFVKSLKRDSYIRFYNYIDSLFDNKTNHPISDTLKILSQKDSMMKGVLDFTESLFAKFDTSSPSRVVGIRGRIKYKAKE